MSERKGFKPMLASLMAAASGFLGNDPLSLPAEAGRLPKKMRGKRKFEGRDKPFFSCGYRGFPRRSGHIGQIPAPTIDQVRRIERKEGRKLHVKFGNLYERDGSLYQPTK